MVFPWGLSVEAKEGRTEAVDMFCGGRALERLPDLAECITRPIMKTVCLFVINDISFFFFNIFGGDFFSFFSVQYSALLHLPSLRFHCADRCWDRTQERCNGCIGSQTL